MSKRDEKRSDESGTSGSSGHVSDLTAATSPRDTYTISEEEHRLYYYGLSKSLYSTPRLIARSGTDQFNIEYEVSGGWNMPREDMKKKMSVVRLGSHVITTIYDTRLRVSMREVLKDIGWHTIDVARVGRNASPDDNDVVVIVTCPKDANVDVTVGMRLVMRCKGLLDE